MNQIPKKPLQPTTVESPVCSPFIASYQMNHCMWFNWNDKLHSIILPKFDCNNNTTQIRLVVHSVDSIGFFFNERSTNHKHTHTLHKNQEIESKGAIETSSKL